VNGNTGVDISFSTRRLTTTVMADSGQIVVLGGLINEEVQESVQKIPILGDIPFLGRLFRTDAVSVTKTNLLIFIRPTIIRDDADLDGASADKYRYIRDQQLLRKERGLMFLDDDLIPVVPEWEEQIKQLDEIKEESAVTEDEGQ